ncbi:hypothetical protein DFH09DRAFT_1100128 [Mycena vulgaris]|nr:hypothetical protein DFH09DRAFT_1100128 [Mycena vulgaris]
MSRGLRLSLAAASGVSGVAVEAGNWAGGLRQDEGQGQNSTWPGKAELETAPGRVELKIGTVIQAPFVCSTTPQPLRPSQPGSLRIATYTSDSRCLVRGQTYSVGTTLARYVF